MMSSEEDPDMSLLEDNKGRASKTKRVRQRVDAGEPRNSYASIPNFSSRPQQGSATPLYHHPHSNGFNATKMLCDLLGTSGLRNSIGQAKADQDMMVLDPERNSAGGVNGSSPLSRMFVNGGELLYGRGPLVPPDSPERCSSAESSNSHLLRDILQQGRQAGKGRGAETSGGHGRESPNCSGSGPPEKLDDEDSNESTGQCRMSAATAARESPATCARSPCGSSRGSSPRNPSSAEAAWNNASEANLPSNPPSSSLEVKRARVETIVSNMLQGPVPGRNNGAGSGLGEPQPPVNGCKKRKLYQPQQHESTNRAPLNGDSEAYDDYDEFEGPDGSPLSKRRSNNNPGLFTFRQQLRQMQQQLVAMQQQYMEMLDGDSTDEEMPPMSAPTSNNPNASDRPRSTEISDCEDMKPRIDSKPLGNNKSRPPSFVDYDNASMYDEQRRLIIDDSKEPTVPPHAENPQKPGLQELRQSCIVQPSPCPSLDYEWLAESLKAELSTSLSQVVDAVVSRCVQRKNNLSKSVPPQENDMPKDPTLLSQMLDRKSPRTGKVIDRGTRVNGHGLCGLRTSPYPPDIATAPKPPFFFPLKPPTSVAATAAFLYGSTPQLPSLTLSQPYVSSPASSTPTPQDVTEQTEPMSLVVTPKKKRHKVTDSRLNQRGQLCGLRSSESSQDVSPKYSNILSGMAPQEPLPPNHLYPHHPPPPPLVPVSLPTTVAIPNPSLNQSELFHNFSYDHHRLSQSFLEPPEDDGPPVGPLHHSGPIHPLLPFHGHQRGSPDSLHLSHMKQDSGDMSDNGDSPAAYDPAMAMISFLPSMHTSTLTPMHLRKAKLMFFYARYPSSAVLKMYFPDIKFNKNNTAQLVKWFSNFREFFYIQMEKYARQAMSEGIKSSDDLKVNPDSELLRVLNLHYNRNNHIEAPENFRYVVENTLREFFKALVAGKDSEQSWKKSIYKIIARMDDNVPEYFKSPNFLETLE
ncbi:homeobox protein prospero-like [Uloborus diversus]|uniref:homeobox protein prospero-like n=1 Tax=Uloborus diversus TaxID=327109 RepID=UPI0024090400|nr:homeobox protein prospero-like [Uloborus diversus]